MRAELAVVWFQSTLKKAGGDLALQEVEWLALFDAGPDDARLTAWREEADPLQLQGKLRHRNLGQGLADVKEGGAVDLADETEGEVELLGWGPAGARQAAAEQGQVIADLLRWVDGDEEALVHGWRVGSTSGLSVTGDSSHAFGMTEVWAPPIVAPAHEVYVGNLKEMTSPSSSR